MRILVAGMFRSGSTRLYNLLREAAAEQVGSPVRAGFPGSDAELERVLALPTPCVVKSHILTDKIVDEIRSGRVTAVATIREPMPALVSMCEALSYSPESAAAQMDQALQWLERIAEAAAIVPYETAVSQRSGDVRRVTRAAGLSIGRRSARRLGRRWDRALGVELSDAAAQPFDPVTLFHPNHVGAPRGLGLPGHATLVAEVERRRLDARFGALCR
ncbi:MAG: hypothetical protein ACJ762_05150 [Solirubrobacteraceae bacterium]